MGSEVRTRATEPDRAARPSAERPAADPFPEPAREPTCLADPGPEAVPARPTPSCTLAVMVGPSIDSRGGMATVARAYQASGLFGPGRVRYIQTVGGGGQLRKLAAAVSALFRYLLVLLSGQAPVLHVLGASGASFYRKAAFIWLARLFRRRIVFHLHGGGFRDFVQRTRWPMRPLVERSMAAADVVLCLSSEMGDWLQASGLGRRVQVFPNPLPADAGAGQPLPCAQRDADILFLGGLTAAKGVDDLIRAFAPLAGRRAASRLLLAGTGERRRLEALATDLGIADRCVFLGWIDGEQKRELMARAAVLALPSYFEGQPMAILEAMAAGMGVVASRVGGIPDLCEDGRLAALVMPGAVEELSAALDAALECDARVDAQVRQARAHVLSRHAGERVREALIELYEELR